MDEVGPTVGSRRAEGFLAQVLQRRRNHGTFTIKFVAQEDHPEPIERFRIATTPTIVVVDGAKVRGRLIEPRGCEEIQTVLGTLAEVERRSS
jgi:hypothetical protein